MKSQPAFFSSYNFCQVFFFDLLLAAGFIFGFLFALPKPAIALDVDYTDPSPPRALTCAGLVGRAPRRRRTVRPAVEELEPRIALVSAAIGNLPDGAVDFLENRLSYVIPGITFTSSTSFYGSYIAGIGVTTLENGNYVPGGYIAVYGGGFYKAASLDPDLPNYIPQAGLTASDIIALKKPKPAQNGRGRPRPQEGPRRARITLQLVPIAEGSWARVVDEKRAMFERSMKKMPPKLFFTLDLKEAERVWGNVPYTIDGFRLGDASLRAEMAVSLIQHRRYEGRRFTLVERDFGKSDGSFSPEVPAYLLADPNGEIHWQLIFLPDRSGKVIAQDGVRIVPYFAPVIIPEEIRAGAASAK